MAYTNNLPILGDLAQELFFDIFNSAPTVGDVMGGPHVRVFQEVKNELNIPDFSVGNLSIPDQCDFVDSARVTGDNILLETCTNAIMWETCKEDFEFYYNSGWAAQAAGAMNTTIQDPVLQVITAMLAKRVRQEVELITWQGDAPGGVDFLSTCDGFLKRLDAAVIGPTPPVTQDPDGNPLTPPGPITVNNILTELSRIYASVPANVVDEHETSTLPYGELRFFVPNAWTRTLKGAWANVNVNENPVEMVDTDMGRMLVYRPAEVPIIGTIGMPPNTVVAALRDTLFWGTDLVSDMSMLNVVDMTNTTNDFKFRVRGRYKIGTQIRRPEYIVYYS